MDNILKEITSVVGVEGCYLCNEEGHLLSSRMPDQYSRDDLGSIGRIISQTISGLSLARRRKVWEVDLVFDRTRLLAKNTGEGCLLIFGTPDMNIHLLNLTADLAVKKIKETTKHEQPTDREAIMIGLPEAVWTLIEFINQILQEAEKQGMSPKEISSILTHRLTKFEKAHPAFEGVTVDKSRLDVSDVSLDDLDRAEGKAGIEFLVYILCLSLKGVLGEEQAEKTYLSVYDDFYQDQKAAFVRLELDDSLRDVIRSDSPPSTSGVEISLD
jgi:predicted regulator of Ras-like GTPase activity (Roadblock/LC7/MglB family)